MSPANVPSPPIIIFPTNAFLKLKALLSFRTVILSEPHLGHIDLSAGHFNSLLYFACFTMAFLPFLVKKALHNIATETAINISKNIGGYIAIVKNTMAIPINFL